TTPRQPRCFRIQRCKLGKMFVNEASRDQVVSSRRQSGRANIRNAEGCEHIPFASVLQHLGRGIDAIDDANALARHPSARAPRSAAAPRHALDVFPPDAFELAQQPQIHVALYSVIVARGPLSVTFTRGYGAVVASIKCAETRHMRVIQMNAPRD